jgi:CO/xanthine dehydrogenase Mo-binding subunit
MWHGVIVHSTVASGQLQAITIENNTHRQMSAIVTASDLPGSNYLNLFENDMPTLAIDKVDHLHQPVALIAAPTLMEARQIRSRARVTVSEQQAVNRLDELVKKWKADESQLVCFIDYRLNNGNCGSAFEEAEHILENEYITAIQDMPSLEPQQVTALPPTEKEPNLRLISTVPLAEYVARVTAGACGIDPERVVIVQVPSGSPSGAQNERVSLLAIYASILALKANRPVRMAAEHAVELEDMTNRDRFWIRLKSAFDKDGRLVAIRQEILFDAGAYIGLAPVIMSRALMHATGVYRCPNLAIRAIAIKSNTPPCLSCRAAGAPQSLFAIEAHIQSIAMRLGISPMDIRWRNILRLKDKLTSGHSLKENVGAAICLEDIAKRSRFDSLYHEISRANQRAEGLIRRGLGLSAFLYMAADSGGIEHILAGRTVLRLGVDGSLDVECINSMPDDNQVLRIRELLSSRLGIDISLIHVKQAVGEARHSLQMAARPAALMDRLIVRASDRLKNTVLDMLGEGVRLAGDSFHLPGGETISWTQAAQIVSDSIPLRIEEAYEFPPSENRSGTRRPPNLTLSWGAAAIEIEIDSETFDVRPINLWISYDVGRPIDPVAARNRLEGEAIQALGFGLCETRLPTENWVPNDRAQAFMIPTAIDAPNLLVNVLDLPYEPGPGTHRRLSILPISGVAGALRNAIQHAIGVSVNRLPITPERIFDARYKEQLDKE